jgi:hypothetical protein
MGEVFHRLARQKEGLIEGGHLMPDHIYSKVQACKCIDRMCMQSLVSGYFLIQVKVSSRVISSNYVRHLFMTSHTSQVIGL